MQSQKHMMHGGPASPQRVVLVGPKTCLWEAYRHFLRRSLEFTAFWTYTQKPNKSNSSLLDWPTHEAVWPIAEHSGLGLHIQQQMLFGRKPGIDTFHRLENDLSFQQRLNIFARIMGQFQVDILEDNHWHFVQISNFFSVKSFDES